jgi:hypothetical protein
MTLWPDSFWSCTLDGCMWQASHTGHLTPKKRALLSTEEANGQVPVRFYVLMDRVVSLSCRESNSDPARSLITIRTELYMYMGASTVSGMCDGSWPDSWQGQEIPLFSETSRLALGPSPSIQRVPTTIYRGVKQSAAWRWHFTSKLHTRLS